MSRLVRVAIITVALLLAALLVPGIDVEWSDDAAGIVATLVVLALVFGVINALIRPVARFASVPLNIATLGMFTVVLNATLLLGVAFLVDLVWGPVMRIGGFPPELDLDAIVTAALGSFIISAVSTALTILIPET